MQFSCEYNLKKPNRYNQRIVFDWICAQFGAEINSARAMQIYYYMKNNREFGHYAHPDAALNLCFLALHEMRGEK